MIKAFSYNKIIVIMLFIYCTIQVYCINQLSINHDEGSFANYGVTLLKFQRKKDVILYESKLPITALNMIPRAIEQIIKPGLTKTWEESKADVIHGRYISLFISVLLGLLIFKWSKELYNTSTGFFCFLFYLLCPNFLAHGIFLSSDIFACFFMTLTFYCLWRFYMKGKNRHFLLMSVATGMAQISKFSMVHLFVIIPILLLSIYIYNRKEKRFNFKKFFVYTAVFLFINWLIICSAHFFYQVFQPMKDYVFISEPFKKLQHFFLWLPAPLPSSYIGSMDAVIYFDQLGGGVEDSLNGAPYILGEQNVKGLWYYYFVAIFFKLPIPALLIWIASLLTLKKFNKKTFFTNEIFLLLPSLYFLIYMNFFYSTQVGIRHLLIIFPLLYIHSGKFISQLLKSKKQLLLYVLAIYQLISVFSYFPHFLPYTNEFILEKKLVYKKIADTNLDYGEGYPFLKKYLDKNKDAIFQPAGPTTGKIVMRANEILNLNISNIHKYDWVRPFHPVDHIHSQYLVFDITQLELDLLQKSHR